MTDVGIILLAVYALVGIGAAVGSGNENDTGAVAFFMFFFAFIAWPILVGFRLTFHKEDSE